MKDIGTPQMKFFLLGHSIVKPFSEEIVNHWIGNKLEDPGELKIKVILLNPYYEDLHRIIRAQTGRDINRQLKDHIHITLEEIKKLKQKISKDELRAGEESFLQIRVTDRIIYNAINIFDDEGIITLYSSKEKIGDESPAFFIKSLQISSTTEEKNSTLNFYKEEFSRFWDSGKHPEELNRLETFNSNKRILNYRHKINRINKWMRDYSSAKLPKPGFLAIHLTNKCTGMKGARVCPTCNFANSPGGENKEIDTDDLLNIIHDAIDFGVYNFEFSGGGEPLEHSGIKNIISELNTMKATFKHVKCGLLTNGLFLNDELIETIFRSKLFSYVRFNYCETIYSNDELYNQFQVMLRKVIEEKSNTGSSSTRIGIKALLKKNGAKKLLNSIFRIKSDLGDLFEKANHLTIKPWNAGGDSPGEEDSREFKNIFYDYLYSYPEEWHKRDIQTDLEFYEIDEKFRCELNPLRAIIDPNANLMICPNYQDKYSQLIIGELNGDTVKFKNLWGGPDHHKKATSIDIEKVCYTKGRCNCRFVKYYEILKSEENGALDGLTELNNFI